ncbi:TolC family protein, partial [Klebsiella pneumoniae]
HPTLVALSKLGDAERLAAESKDNELMPTIQLFAKSAYEYPNGPLDERVWQNSYGLSVSMPIFDGGQVDSLSAG